MKVLVTMPPYAPYMEEVLKHPITSGIRINTVMTLKESKLDFLKRMNAGARGKEIWIDLKGRQIRVSRSEHFNAPEEIKEPRVYKIGSETFILDPQNPRTRGHLQTPPWATIRIDKNIELDCSKPVPCYFKGGEEKAHIVEIISHPDGDELIMLDGPRRVVGSGEAINIMHPSFKIKNGPLTESDKEYLAAAQKMNIDTFMYSFGESTNDIEAILAIYPQAKIVMKIESRAGILWANREFKSSPELGLMAACGDLYTELERPDRIITAFRTIIRQDPRAIAASRILESLLKTTRPTCAEVAHVAYLLNLGYTTLMLGDEICLSKEPLLLALDVLEAIAKKC